MRVSEASAAARPKNRAAARIHGGESVYMVAQAKGTVGSGEMEMYICP